MSVASDHSTGREEEGGRVEMREFILPSLSVFLLI